MVSSSAASWPIEPHRSCSVTFTRRERLVNVAPGGGDVDAEAGGEAGVGVAVTQVSKGEPGLPTGVETPRPHSADPKTESRTGERRTNGAITSATANHSACIR
jgi:hypothetical protein